jgi:hemin uptake protein HemP
MSAPENRTLGAADTLPVHNATDLTQGGVLAYIRLDRRVYTLRITRSGKLILTR